MSLWFLARNKNDGGFRDRRGETLFIDARNMGTMISRTQRELTDEDMARITGTYHAWRGETGAGEYDNVPGFCASATIDVIREGGFTLTPGRYIGIESEAINADAVEANLIALSERLSKQLDAAEEMSLKVRNVIRKISNV